MEGVAEVVSLFIDETRLRLRRIGSAGEGPSRLTHEVHTLKGAAGTVCAAHLGCPRGGAGRAIAQAAARWSTGDVEALTGAFEAYVTHVRDVIPLEQAVA